VDDGVLLMKLEVVVEVDAEKILMQLLLFVVEAKWGKCYWRGECSLHFHNH
jgi:hypothetical protein